MKYDVDDAEDAYWLFAQFVAFICNGCTIAPPTDYTNNKVYQDLTKADKYFSSHEKMYINLRKSEGYTNKLESLTRDDNRLTLTVMLKDATTIKIRLTVTGYSQDQCYCVLSSHGLIMRYKKCGNTKDKNMAA